MTKTHTLIPISFWNHLSFLTDISQQSFTTQCDILRDDYESSTILTFFTHHPYSPWWFHIPCLPSPFPGWQTNENRTLLAGKFVCSFICSCLPSLYFQQTLFWNRMLCFSTGLCRSAIQIPTAITFFFPFQVPLQQFICNILTIVEYWTDSENCINTNSYFPGCKKQYEFMNLYVLTVILHYVTWNLMLFTVPQDPSTILHDVIVHSLFQIFLTSVSVTVIQHSICNTPKFPSILFPLPFNHFIWAPS